MMVYSYIIINERFSYFELHRFGKLNKYLIHKFKKFSLYNLFIQVVITLTYICVFIIMKVKIDFSVILNYAINLFVIFEIIYIFCLSNLFSKKTSKINYVLLFIFYFMFLLYVINGANGVLSFNIFSSYFKNRDIFTTIFNYLLWMFIAIIFLYNKKDKVEI